MNLCCFVFFFKQKTAYEIGTGDWSSDVCSSDLRALGNNKGTGEKEEQLKSDKVTDIQGRRNYIDRNIIVNPKRPQLVTTYMLHNDSDL